MDDIAKQIEDIEEVLRKTPHHKGTNHFIGKMRAKISRLKDKEIEYEQKTSGGGGGGYSVKQHGDATVVLVGPPSAGKSTLINKLTNAQSRVAAYAFTTTSVIPGMMEYKEARIQILDVPGLIEGAEEGKGRGREVLSVIRNCHLLIFITDVERQNSLFTLSDALERNGIRINQIAPNVVIDRKESGGIIVHTNIKQEFDKETVKDAAIEFGIKNADITLKEKLTFDRLLDSFSKSRVYVPAIFVINKIDTINNPDSCYNELIHDNKPILISADKDINLDELKEKIYQSLRFLRIYLIKEGENPHLNNPMVVREGQTLEDIKKGLGTNFDISKTSAKIWGPGSKFPGQIVSLTTKVTDKMQIRFE